MSGNSEEVDVKIPLIQKEIDMVAGGRFKRPLQRPITVYYDDCQQQFKIDTVV